MARYIELEYKDIKDDYILIDLRSEGEYEEDPIPNAISLPILNNEEREKVGKTYKRQCREKAKTMAVKAASEKLPEIYETIKKLEDQYDKVILFCAKGGMRSTVLTKLLVNMGSKVYKLKDGYKNYRAYVNENLPKINSEIEYIVLQGNTGTGKTEILKKLKKRGYNILDLEGCANHRGSFLGSVGMGNSNSQKKIEALIYEELKQRKGNTVIVEGESKRIGRSLIPEYIYQNMKDSKRLLINVDLDHRVQNIIDEYTQSQNWRQETREGLNRLEKYLGQKNIEKYHKMLDAGDIGGLVKDLMKKYYDPMYKKGQDKYNYEITINVNDKDKACDIIEQWMKKNE